MKQLLGTRDDSRAQCREDDRKRGGRIYEQLSGKNACIDDDDDDNDRDLTNIAEDIVSNSERRDNVN